MKTELVLASALRELMSKESLDTITVKRLSDMCGIKRQTFYYHFRDIYDLLTWIFLNEDIKAKGKIDSWQDSVRVIVKYIEKNKKFIKNTLSSAGRELFHQFVSSYFYSAFLQRINKLDVNGKLTSDEKRFYVSYYVSGITHSIISWIDNGMKEEENRLIDNLEIVVGAFVDGVVKVYNKPGRK